MDTRLYKSSGKKINKQLLYIVVLLFLTYITFHILLKDINFEELYYIIKRLDITMCILGLLSIFVFISCEALVFKTILSILDEKLSFLQTLKYSIIGFYFSSITPSASGGQPMQLYYMKKDSISISRGTLTVFITLITYQIIMIAYASVSIMLNLPFILGGGPVIYPLIIFGFVANIIVTGFILLSMFSSGLILSLSNPIIRLLYKVRIIKEMEKVQEHTQNQINQYKEGALIIRNNPKSILFILFITFIQHTSMYCITYFVYRALGLNGISMWNILGLQAVAYIASSSIPLPGSVGVSETASLLILKNIFPMNLLPSAVLIIRVISFYIMIIITGLFSMVIGYNTTHI